MKMKTKIGKSGVFAALTVVLLVTAVLITSCDSPSGAKDEYTPPSGKGYVNVNISDAVGRSITTALTFTEFDLTFMEYDDNTFATPTGTTIPVTGLDDTDIGDPINLNPGYYKLKVLAKTGSGTPDDMAEGESAGFQITAGVGTNVTVPVGPLLTGSGVGMFGYTVNIAGVTNPLPNFLTDTLTLSITQINISSSWTNIANQDISGSLSSTISSLPTGYYYVDIVLTVSGQVASVRQVLHIYDSETSLFTYTFVNGQFIVTMGRATVSIDPDLKPVLQRSDPTGAVAEGGTITLSRDAATTPTPVPETTTITVTNAALFDTFEWYVNSTTAISSTDSLAITAGVGSFVADKIYLVTVIGTTYGGIPYSTFFSVTITP